MGISTSRVGPVRAGSAVRLRRRAGEEGDRPGGAVYGVRMAAVFMMSLATIWLKTGLMPRPLVYATYLVAVALLIAGNVSMWIVLAFPLWVLAVSLLILIRAGVIDLHAERESSA